MFHKTPHERTSALLKPTGPCQDARAARKYHNLGALRQAIRTLLSSEEAGRVVFSGHVSN